MLSVISYLANQILSLYSFLIIIYVLINILISFNIINGNNSFVNLIMDSLYRIIEPLLIKIRKILPDFGGLDLSPVLLLIFIRTIQFAILKYSI